MVVEADFGAVAHHVRARRAVDESLDKWARITTG
jgi:hypothetical protein